MIFVCELLCECLSWAVSSAPKQKGFPPSVPPHLYLVPSASSKQGAGQKEEREGGGEGRAELTHTLPSKEYKIKVAAAESGDWRYSTSIVIFVLPRSHPTVILELKTSFLRSSRKEEKGESFLPPLRWKKEMGCFLIGAISREIGVGGAVWNGGKSANGGVVRGRKRGGEGREMIAFAHFESRRDEKGSIFRKKECLSLFARVQT